MALKKPSPRAPENTHERADLLLVRQGLAPSRSRAQALIAAGCVALDGEVLNRPGQRLALGAPLTVLGTDHPWVSRGGVKLAHALQHFQISIADQICLDLGASTGGFTDCLLAAGAARVYAVDVGRDQLAEKLRQDNRVVNLEATHSRDLDRHLIADSIECLVSDVSFISLTKALPAALALTATTARAILLVKPQFEVGAAHIGKGGVVRDEAVQTMACDQVAGWMAQQSGWQVDGICASPLLGAGGNQEYLLAARRTY